MDKKIVIIGFVVVALAIIYIIFQLNKEKKLWESQIKINDVLLKNFGLELTDIDNSVTESVTKSQENEEVIPNVEEQVSNENTPESVKNPFTEVIVPKRKYTKKNTTEEQQTGSTTENSNSNNSPVTVVNTPEEENNNSDDSGESNDNKLSGE